MNKSSMINQKNLPVLPKYQWLNIAQFYKKSIVFYQDIVYDLGDFMSFHPNGKQAITPFINKDITKILFNVYPHQKDVLKRLAKYQIGKINFVNDYVSFKQIRSQNKYDKNQSKSASKSKKQFGPSNQSTNSGNRQKSNSIGISSKKVTFKIIEQKKKQKSKSKKNRKVLLQKKQDNRGQKITSILLLDSEKKLDYIDFTNQINQSFSKQQFNQVSIKQLENPQKKLLNDNTETETVTPKIRIPIFRAKFMNQLNSSALHKLYK